MEPFSFLLPHDVSVVHLNSRCDLEGLRKSGHSKTVRQARRRKDTLPVARPFLVGTPQFLGADAKRVFPTEAQLELQSSAPDIGCATNKLLTPQASHEPQQGDAQMVVCPSLPCGFPLLQDEKYAPFATQNSIRPVACASKPGHSTWPGERFHQNC